MAAAVRSECGCTGIRKCLLCEDKDKFKCVSINALEEERSKTMRQYTFCIRCGRTLQADQKCTHRERKGEGPGTQDGVGLEGVSVILGFVTDIEEQTIVAEIDRTIWKPSQSGRRKQVKLITFLFFKFILCVSMSLNIHLRDTARYTSCRSYYNYIL